MVAMEVASSGEATKFDMTGVTSKVQKETVVLLIDIHDFGAEIAGETRLDADATVQLVKGISEYQMVLSYRRDPGPFFIVRLFPFNHF